MPTETWAEYFQRIVEDERTAKATRALAERLLLGLRQGIIPSRRDVERLRAALPSNAPCRKLEWDGACTWLRETGGSLGLAVPMHGERAMCQYKEAWQRCPGYDPLEGEEV